MYLMLSYGLTLVQLGRFYHIYSVFLLITINFHLSSARLTALRFSHVENRRCTFGERQMFAGGSIDVYWTARVEQAR